MLSYFVTDIRGELMKKVVLVTGGSRGIGAATVRAFANAGYDVAFIYNKNDEAAKAVSDETGALAFKADVANVNDVKRAVDAVKDSLGSVDVLVNNAGISQIKLFTDITDENWERMMGVNLTGAFNCTKAVIGDMINRKSGSIINISSMWGEVGASCEVHYSAAKAAMIGMTKALAKEMGLSGIRVNCITPGVIATEMNGELDDETLESLKEETPLGRIGTPEDVANTALFLASDAASFITGQVIGVNGGFII